MYSYTKKPLTIDLSLLQNYLKAFYDKYLDSLNEVNFQCNIS